MLFAGHGLIYNGGSVNTFDIPSAYSTGLASINNSGEVAGEYTDSTGMHGFVYNGTTVTSFDPPSANANIYVSSINGSGEVAGEYVDSTGGHGFVYNGTSVIALDAPSALQTTVTGINDSGEVAGYYYDSSGNAHGFTAFPASLFTNGPDNVNFNKLTAAQKSAIDAGADLYKSLGGNDTVVLPDPANYQLTSKVAWNPAQTFTMGDWTDNLTLGAGNDKVNLGNGPSDNVASTTGNKTVTVGNGSDDNIVLLGSGNDIVTVGSGTDSKVVVHGTNNTITTKDTAGETDFITVFGNATATVGDGNDTISLGDGDNLVVLGKGNDTVKLGTSGPNGNFVYGGTAGNQTITGGPGNDFLIGGFGAHSVLTGNGGVDEFGVGDGDEITDFIAGDKIAIFTSSDIDSAVITQGAAPTTLIQVFNANNLSATITLDGRYDPTSFSSAQDTITANRLDVTYGGTNPTTVIDALKLPIFDAQKAINASLQAAKGAFIDASRQLATRELFLASIKGASVALFPEAALGLNAARFVYDVGYNLVKWDTGEIGTTGLAGGIEAAFLDFYPGVVVAFGANIAEQVFNSALSYLQSIDAKIKDGTIPLPSTSTPLQIQKVGTANLVSLNDPAQVSNLPAGSGNDTFVHLDSPDDVTGCYKHLGGGRTRRTGTYWKQR
jgi:Ca2+-binding RTX toxin-like protein